MHPRMAVIPGLQDLQQCLMDKGMAVQRERAAVRLEHHEVSIAIPSRLVKICAACTLRLRRSSSPVIVANK